MKNITVISTIVFIFLVLGACSSTQKTLETITYTSFEQPTKGAKITLDLIAGDALNHPTYVIWQEDMDGNYIQTLFITESYANGIFGHEMQGDTLWLKKPGTSHQPAALPYWAHKKGLINGKELTPSPDHPFTDAYTGATPRGNLKFKTKIEGFKPYRILMEINQPWDWNQYWTNNKYPDNPAYKHSAQPSLIYAVSVVEGESDFYLNPIGHGDPKGESGKLYTDISSISSAKDIIKSVKIAFEK